jgi:hypothetical protein
VRTKETETPCDRVVQKFTKASKLVSSFGRKMFNYIEEDGRIHGSLKYLLGLG